MDMTPAQLEALGPLLALAIVAFVVSIPVVAFSARFAIKPVVDALIRLREAQGKSGADHDMLMLQDRRLSLLESEMQHITTSLERLADAQEFQASLNTGALAGLSAPKSAQADIPEA
jgi:hypothetical protein